MLFADLSTLLLVGPWSSSLVHDPSPPARESCSAPSCPTDPDQFFSGVATSASLWSSLSTLAPIGNLPEKSNLGWCHLSIAEQFAYLIGEIPGGHVAAYALYTHVGMGCDPKARVFGSPLARIEAFLAWRGTIFEQMRLSSLCYQFPDPVTDGELVRSVDHLFAWWLHCFSRQPVLPPSDVQQPSLRAAFGGDYSSGVDSVKDCLEVFWRCFTDVAAFRGRHGGLCRGTVPDDLGTISLRVVSSFLASLGSEDLTPVPAYLAFRRSVEGQQPAHVFREEFPPSAGPDDASGPVAPPASDDVAMVEATAAPSSAAAVPRAAADASGPVAPPASEDVAMAEATAAPSSAAAVPRAAATSPPAHDVSVAAAPLAGAGSTSQDDVEMTEDPAASDSVAEASQAAEVSLVGAPIAALVERFVAESRAPIARISIHSGRNRVQPGSPPLSDAVPAAEPAAVSDAVAAAAGAQPAVDSPGSGAAEAAGNRGAGESYLISPAPASAVPAAETAASSTAAVSDAADVLPPAAGDPAAEASLGAAASSTAAVSCAAEVPPPAAGVPAAEACPAAAAFFKAVDPCPVPVTSAGAQSVDGSPCPMPETYGELVSQSWDANFSPGKDLPEPFKGFVLAMTEWCDDLARREFYVLLQGVPGIEPVRTWARVIRAEFACMNGEPPAPRVFFASVVPGMAQFKHDPIRLSLSGMHPTPGFEAGGVAEFRLLPAEQAPKKPLRLRFHDKNEMNCNTLFTDMYPGEYDNVVLSELDVLLIPESDETTVVRRRLSTVGGSTGARPSIFRPSVPFFRDADGVPGNVKRRKVLGAVSTPEGEAPFTPEQFRAFVAADFFDVPDCDKSTQLTYGPEQFRVWRALLALSFNYPGKLTRCEAVVHVMMLMAALTPGSDVLDVAATCERVRKKWGGWSCACQAACDAYALFPEALDGPDPLTFCGSGLFSLLKECGFYCHSGGLGACCAVFGKPPFCLRGCAAGQSQACSLSRDGCGPSRSKAEARISPSKAFGVACWQNLATAFLEAFPDHPCHSAKAPSVWEFQNQSKAALLCSSNPSMWWTYGSNLVDGKPLAMAASSSAVVPVVDPAGPGARVPIRHLRLPRYIRDAYILNGSVEQLKTKLNFVFGHCEVDCEPVGFVPFTGDIHCFLGCGLIGLGHLTGFGCVDISEAGELAGLKVYVNGGYGADGCLTPETAINRATLLREQIERFWQDSVPVDVGLSEFPGCPSFVLESVPEGESHTWLWESMNLLETSNAFLGVVAWLVEVTRTHSFHALRSVEANCPTNPEISALLSRLGLAFSAVIGSSRFGVHTAPLSKGAFELDFINFFSALAQPPAARGETVISRTFSRGHIPGTLFHRESGHGAKCLERLLDGVAHPAALYRIIQLLNRLIVSTLVATRPLVPLGTKYGFQHDEKVMSVLSTVIQVDGLQREAARRVGMLMTPHLPFFDALKRRAGKTFKQRENLTIERAHLFLMRVCRGAYISHELAGIITCGVLIRILRCEQLSQMFTWNALVLGGKPQDTLPASPEALAIRRLTNAVVLIAGILVARHEVSRTMDPWQGHVRDSPASAVDSRYGNMTLGILVGDALGRLPVLTEGESLMTQLSDHFGLSRNLIPGLERGPDVDAGSYQAFMSCLVANILFLTTAASRYPEEGQMWVLHCILGENDIKLDGCANLTGMSQAESNREEFYGLVRHYAALHVAQLSRLLDESQPPFIEDDVHYAQTDDESTNEYRNEMYSVLFGASRRRVGRPFPYPSDWTGLDAIAKCRHCESSSCPGYCERFQRAESVGSDTDDTDSEDDDVTVA